MSFGARWSDQPSAPSEVLFTIRCPGHCGSSVMKLVLVGSLAQLSHYLMTSAKPCSSPVPLSLSAKGIWQGASFSGLQSDGTLMWHSQTQLALSKHTVNSCFCHRASRVKDALLNGNIINVTFLQRQRGSRALKREPSVNNQKLTVTVVSSQPCCLNPQTVTLCWFSQAMATLRRTSSTSPFWKPTLPQRFASPPWTPSLCSH